jgi:ribosomal protein L13
MTLNRQTLAKIDKQILSHMDHGDGVQLVKVSHVRLTGVRYTGLVVFCFSRS